MTDKATQALIDTDTANRKAALGLHSYIVEAPAGAGKTELLTQRYLKLLALVDTPEEIIALTFTNKAAAEMRNRILDSLLAAQAHTPVNAPHQVQTRELALQALARAEQRQWHLLTQPSRFRILTIDALCASLANQMPLLSRLGGQPRVAEDASIHYLEAAKRTLAMVSDEPSLDSPISRVLRFMQNDMQKLSLLLAEMLAKREQWLPYTNAHQQLDIADITQQCRQIIAIYIEDKLADALAVLTPNTQRQLMPIVHFAASQLDESPLSALQDWQTPFDARAAFLPQWLLLTDFLLKKDKDGGFRQASGLNASVGFPAKHPEQKAYVAQFAAVIARINDSAPLQALRDLPCVSTEEIEENSRIVQAFNQVLQLAAAHLLQIFQAAGEVDFVAIARAAINALQDEDEGTSDLALKLDYKISHLLVDEFQDTNASQKTLLELLTKGWQADDERTLFCVGDPMQSIYRFRKADVSLFLQAMHQGIGHLTLLPLKLSRNNRSYPTIVDWINAHFAAIFPSKDNPLEAAIRYRDFIATRSSTAEEGVFVHPLLVHEDTESANANLDEAHYVARLIAQEQQKIPGQRIAVLVRSRTHLHDLVSEIRRHFSQLKFQAVEIEALASKQSVQDALSLTRAMLHPADRVHWLNLLRSPWCGLTLSDLYALCAHDHRATIWQLMQAPNGLSEDGLQRLAHVRQVLAPAFAAQGRIPLRRWLESTWLQLGGGSTLVNAGDERDVQTFFDLVEKLAQGYKLDFAQLETAMGQLYAEPDSDASGHLQFLTIHKSKGLEFDCVILPALNRKPRQPDAPLMLWEEVHSATGDQLLAAPYRKSSKNASPGIYSYIKQIETARAAHETARLLYVAATRAISRLHLIGSVNASTMKPTAQSLLALLWPSVKKDFEQATHRSARDTPTQKLADFIAPLVRLPIAALLPVLATEPSADVSITSQPAISQPDAAATPSLDDAPKVVDLAADKGTLAHLYMELISQTGLESWADEKLDRCQPAMTRWLQARGHATAQSVDAANAVTKLLRTTLASDAGRWVLAKRPGAFSELAIYRAGPTPEEKRIDRTFVEHGVRWIIDYKSMELDKAISDAALTALAAPFKPQLAAYVDLFTEENLPIKQAIFFMSIGRYMVI